MAPGAPRTPRALSCMRKFVHEPAFCSHVSNGPRTCLSVTAADTQPRLRWGPAPETPPAATGLAGGLLLPPLSPGTQHIPPPRQQPRLAPHHLNAHQPERELAQLAACSPLLQTTGTQGGGERAGAIPAPVARGAGSKPPLQTASTGASASMRLSQLRLQIAKGSFTQTARNRKFNRPQCDHFYSYSGKYNCSFQHLRQLRTGIIRSTRPPGPVHRCPAPQSATKENAGSAQVRLWFCRQGCQLRVLLPFPPPLPCASLPFPCPSCSTSSEPALWQDAPCGWLCQLSPFRVRGGGSLPEHPSVKGANACPPSGSGCTRLRASYNQGSCWGCTKVVGAPTCSFRFTSKQQDTEFEIGKGHSSLTLSLSNLHASRA